MTTLGEARLELTADTGPLERGLEQAERSSLQRIQSIGRGLTVAVTGPIIGIGAAIFGATEEIDEAFATIRSGTGATGDSLLSLQDDFMTVFGAVPADAQTVATAIADLNTRLGLTGQPLQEAAIAAIEMADALGVEAEPVITSTTRAMQFFNEESENVVPLLDAMFVASQQTGIGVDELSSALQVYGPVLANAGYSMEESIALFSQLNAAGADASRVFPGINAFLRRAADEAFPDFSEQIDQSRESIDDLTDAMGSNRDRLAEVNERIAELTEDSLERHNTALERNRDSYEDLQERLDEVTADSLEEHQDAIDDNRTAYERLQDRIDDLRSNSLERHTEALADNREAHREAQQRIEELSERSLADYSEAIEDNEDALRRAEQALIVHNLRTEEFNENTSAATRQAALFRQQDLEQTIADLRVEQERLAQTGPEVTRQQQELMQSLGQLDLELRNLRESGPEVTRQQEQLAESLATLDQEFQSLNESGPEVSRQQQQLAESLAEVDSEFQNLRESGPEVTRQQEELMEEVAELDAEYVQLFTDLDTARNALNTFIEQQANAVPGVVDLRKALEDQVAVIRDAEDPAVALALTTEAFGNEGAARLSSAIRQGAFDIEEFVGVLENAEGAIVENADATETLTERAMQLRYELSERLAGAWGALPEPIQATALGLGGVLASIGPILTVLPGLIMGMRALSSVSLSLAFGPIGLLVFAIGLLAIGAVILWQNWETVERVTLRVWNNVVGFLTGIWDSIVGIFRDNWMLVLGILFPAYGIVQFFIEHWGTIADFLTGVWDAIVGLVRDNWMLVLGILFPAYGIAQFFIEHWGAITGILSGIWDAIVGLVRDNWMLVLGILFPPYGIAQLIEEHWEPIVGIMSGIWDGVVEVIRGAINTAIGILNGFIRSWNRLEINIPGFSRTVSAFGRSYTIGFDGFSLGLPDVPEIPMLQQGGIVTSPTLVMAGEAGAEAIIPLSNLREGFGGRNVTNNIIFEGTIVAEDIEDLIANALFDAEVRGAFGGA